MSTAKQALDRLSKAFQKICKPTWRNQSIETQNEPHLSLTQVVVIPQHCETVENATMCGLHPPHHISTLPSPTATHPSVTCKEIEDDDVIAAEHRRNDPIHWLSFCDREGRAVLDTGPSAQVTTIWAAKWTKCVCSCITTHHWNVWVDGRVKYRSENFKKSSEGSYLARHLCA